MKSNIASGLASYRNRRIQRSPGRDAELLDRGWREYGLVALPLKFRGISQDDRPIGILKKLRNLTCAKHSVGTVHLILEIAAPQTAFELRGSKWESRQIWGWRRAVRQWRQNDPDADMIGQEQA